jgi:quercetin dioxygenase-like cupin family protein
MDASSVRCLSPPCRSACPRGCAEVEERPGDLPNVPGKSIKGVLVEYGPGGYSPWSHASQSAFIYATVLEGEILSQVNDGPVTTYKAGQSFSELPGDRHGVSVTRPAATTNLPRLVTINRNWI